MNLDILLLKNDNFTSNVWGGDWISKWKGLSRPKEKIVGESWEFSLHPHHPSSVEIQDGGALSLLDLKKEQAEALWGRPKGHKHQSTVSFLLKIIDAHDNLSVQVHPDDIYSREHENDNGKIESWIVLDAEKGSVIYLGFNSSSKNREDYFQPNKIKGLIKALNKIPVKKGDIFHVPAGTIHALGKGVRICEIQQSSDITYRIWDWDRDKRPLDIEKAKEVADMSIRPVSYYKKESHPLPSLMPDKVKEEVLIKSKEGHYALNQIQFNSPQGEVEISVLGEFFTLTGIEGTVELLSSKKSQGLLKPWGDLPQGRTVIVPASLSKVKVRAKSDRALIFKAYAV